MESVVNAIIAVAGTLLGSIATYAFQRAQADRVERAAQTERLRQERLAAYAEFAGAVTDLRRAAHGRWQRSHEGRGDAELEAVRDEYYRLYTVARNAQIKLRLLTIDSKVIDLAHQAIVLATEIKDAATKHERVARGERAKAALDGFLVAASA